MSSTYSTQTNYCAAQSLRQTINDTFNMSTISIPSSDPPPYEEPVTSFYDSFYPDFDTTSSFDNESESNEISERRFDPSIPHPIFPPIYLNRLQTISDSSRSANYTADQPLIGFDHDLWTRVWYNQELELDSYLEYIRSPDNETLLLPWRTEYTFKGASYRLTVSHFRCDEDLPLFREGMSISFSNCNGLDYRYVIDHCVHVDDFNAYIKVVCFDSCQFYYDMCSNRPPLILTVPKSHCRVRMHPNLETHLVTSVSSKPHKSLSSFLWQRFFHKK